MEKLIRLVDFGYPSFREIRKIEGEFELEYLGMKFKAPGPILSLFSFKEKYILHWITNDSSKPNIAAFDKALNRLWTMEDTKKLGHNQMGSLAQEEDGRIRVWNGAIYFDIDLHTGKLSNPVYCVW